MHARIDLGDQVQLPDPPLELPDAEGDETRGGQREKPQQQHRAERLARPAPLGRRLRRVGGVQGAALMAASTWPGIMLVSRWYMTHRVPTSEITTMIRVKITASMTQPPSDLEFMCRKKIT